MRTLLKRLFGSPSLPVAESSRADPPAAATLEARLREEADRRSATDPEAHWIFDHFPDRSYREDGWFICMLGSRTREEVAPHIQPHQRPLVTHPSKGEEYFEWIDVLQGALEAGDTYTFLELGAGWGRWSSRAYMAAKALGKRCRLGLAEAEPQHLAWLHQHMADNGIAADDYRVFDGAVSGAAGKDNFLVELSPAHPHYESANSPRDWYGQSLYWDEVAPEPVGTYFDRPVYAAEGGWRTIEVDRIPLVDILAQYDRIDLLDFDTQGAEADAIEASLDMLTEKVRRLHIGTHGQDIEARLMQALQAAGWVCVRSYGCHQENETNFGRFEFCDGVQSWVNPHLAADMPAA